MQGIVLGLAVAVLLFLVGYPLLWLMLGALGLPQSIGLEHLQRAFTRPQNYAALVNTLQLALGTGIMSVFSVCRWLGRRRAATCRCGRWCTRWSRSPTSRRPT